jgi:hypothetical protein
MLVSKFAKDANLYHQAPYRKPGANGRARKKGKPIAKRVAIVARSSEKKLKVR